MIIFSSAYDVKYSTLSLNHNCIILFFWMPIGQLINIILVAIIQTQDFFSRLLYLHNFS